MANEIKSSPIWKRSDGAEITISDMNIHHVRNALAQIEANPDHEQAGVEGWLRQRKLELEA